ncbi:MAG: YigZ family protein [Clostridiaceae bacterium]|nr:YigZ family protein [Clostridiaceae bacterium]
MEPYKVPAGVGAAEFTEKKSRFIGRLFPVETEETAIEKLKSLRKQHWDASHNVWAYILHAGAVRFSDDGEPQGTAGMPALEVLRREELSDVLCVVTRYFGGTLLGAGGLTRAYARAAKMAVDAAGIAEMLPYAHLQLVCPYDLLEPVRRALPMLDAEESGTEYGEQVVLEVLLPSAEQTRFETQMADLTSGRLKPVYLGEKMFAKRLR